MQTRSLLFVVTAFALTACPEDMTTEKATWEATTQGWTARLEKMKRGHDELVTKAKSFAVPETEVNLVENKVAIDKSIAIGSTAIANAEREVATAKTTMDSAFAAGKKVRVEVSLGTTKSTVDGALARAESLISAANSNLDTLNTRIASAKAAGEAIKSRTEAWLVEVKKKDTELTVEDLVFNGEGLDAEKSKIALTSLVATFKACPDLRTSLTVVARGEGAELGTKRAEAIKSQLAAQGVDAAMLTKVEGSVVTEGDEKVSLAVTTACK